MLAEALSYSTALLWLAVLFIAAGLTLLGIASPRFDRGLWQGLPAYFGRYRYVGRHWDTPLLSLTEQFDAIAAKEIVWDTEADS